MIPGYESLEVLQPADQAIVLDLITALTVSWHRFSEAAKRSGVHDQVLLTGLRDAVEGLFDELVPGVADQLEESTAREVTQA